MKSYKNLKEGWKQESEQRRKAYDTVADQITGILDDLQTHCHNLADDLTTQAKLAEKQSGNKDTVVNFTNGENGGE